MALHKIDENLKRNDNEIPTSPTRPAETGAAYQKAAEEKGPLASRFKAHPTFLVVSTCYCLELHSKFKLGGCPRNVSQVPGCNPQKHHLPSPKQRPFTLVHWERLLRLPLSPSPVPLGLLPPLHTASLAPVFRRRRR